MRPTGKQSAAAHKGQIASARKGLVRHVFLTGRSATLAGIKPHDSAELRQWRVAVRYWQGDLRQKLSSHMTRFKISKEKRKLVYAFGHNFLLKRRPPNDPITPNGFRTPTIEELRSVFPFIGAVHVSPPRIVE